MHGFAETSQTVICVCGSEGYPYGFGGAARITLVGKAVQAAGLNFHILHCGPSPLLENTRTRGIHKGISFEYTTSLAKPKNRLARLLVYARAVMGLTWKLVRLRAVREHITVYLYHMHGLLNLFAGALCQCLGVSVVQEMCEWWLEDPGCSALTRWLFRGRIFKASTGLLVISKEIERRARERAAKINPRLAIYRLPTVVDLDRFAVAFPPSYPADNHIANFVWCGTIDGWVLDVMFLLSVLAHARRSRPCQLTLIGKYSDATAAVIMQKATSLGLAVVAYGGTSANASRRSFEDVCLAGWVDEATLLASFRDATALLLPLWDDDRSKTRMPNKLGEYLASGKPVITSRVGDLTDFLADGVNAFLATPGDERDFADRMLAILGDPQMAARVGAAGRQVCEQHFDYRVHAIGLARFFGDCLEPLAHLRTEGSSV
jgi:glycosyltransferase involved in cell wall biosynthesis